MYEIIEKQKIRNRNHYLVKTKYGLCTIACDKWNLGRRPSIQAALNKTEYFINQANEVHNFRFDYSNSTYVDSKTKLQIVCKSGHKFSQSPNSHLQGQGCRKCYDLELNGYHKTDTLETFISKANKIHNNLYDYSNFTYINSRTKSSVTCKIHGGFEQKPSDHLQGKGCPKCSDLLLGWTRTDFRLRCQQNNNGFGVLYIIRCFNENESFYKIGITSSNLPRRYNSNHSMPYKYEVIQEIRDISDNIYNLEVLIKKYISVNGLKYLPLIKFGGSATECFQFL